MKTYSDPKKLEEDFQKAIQKPLMIAEILGGLEILYGLPKAQANGKNVAEYGRLVHDGSFTQNIPSRPYLRTVKDVYGSKINSDIKKALEEIKEEFTKNDINKAKIKQIIEKFVALPLQNYTKSNVVNGDWTPNSATTIKKKGSSKPLIDTGELVNRIIALVDEV